MPDWLIKYFGGGLLIIVSYIIISNTLWLLFGSKLIQTLPGVNINGATGTLKIAILIVMSFTGIVVWIFKFPFIKYGFLKEQSLRGCISYYIQSASKVFAKRF